MGWKIPQIALVHSALQTQGFLACFVVGFLTTAFPRFTGSRSVTGLEMGMMLVGLLSFLINALTHLWLWAELSFLFVMINLIVFAARRVPGRKKSLPPSFLLMGFGFAHAIVGPILMVGSRFGMANYTLFSIGRQMMQVGFLLCMVLGITGKLAPFLLGYTDDPESGTENESGLRQGKTAVLIHGLTGAGLMLSFFLEPFSFRLGWGIRAALVTFHLLTFARIARPLKKKTTLMFLFHLSCWMIPLGLWIGFVWPNYRIASLHILFLGGFSLMIFSFGLLIVLSHSGKALLINSRLIPLKVVGSFVVCAMVLRFLAEVVAEKNILMIHMAAGFWLLAALVWGGYTFPKIFLNPPASLKGAE